MCATPHHVYVFYQATVEELLKKNKLNVRRKRAHRPFSCSQLIPLCPTPRSWTGTRRTGTGTL